MLQVTSRKCSYNWFTKVNTKSHNSSFHPYNLLSSQPGCCPRKPSTAAQSPFANTSHTHTHTHTHTPHTHTHTQCLELGINTIHHIPTPPASFLLTWLELNSWSEVYIPWVSASLVRSDSLSGKRSSAAHPFSVDWHDLPGVHSE